MNTFEDVKTRDEAVEWGKSLLEKGLIGKWSIKLTTSLAEPVEHVTGVHGFFDYNHFFYRLRPAYDPNAAKRKSQWFGGKTAAASRNVIERHAALVNSPPNSAAPVAKLSDGVKKKRKIRMSQTAIIDLDPLKKSDRAEMAILHADVIHNARNA